MEVIKKQPDASSAIHPGFNDARIAR